MFDLGARIALVTSCSQTSPVAPLALIQNMPVDISTEEAIKWWVTEYRKYSDQAIPARQLYQGLGFFTLGKILSDYKIDEVYVMSAGVGLNGLDDPMVPYDWSSSINDQYNIYQHVTKEPFVISVWWKRINEELRAVSSPVRVLLDRDDIDYVLVSVGKRFVKWITDDVLGTKHPEKLRILISRSSLGGVAQQLRSQSIGIDRALVTNIPGNRNDVHQRNLMAFLAKIRENPELMKQPPAQLQKLFLGSMMPGAGRTNLLDLFNDHAAFSSLDPETAYKFAKQLSGNLGGKTTFKATFAAWLHDIHSDTEEEIAEEKVAAGAAALSGLSFLSKSVVVDDADGERESIKLLEIFAEVLRQNAPLTIFNAANVVEWATRYGQVSETTLPEYFKSANRLTQLLKSVAPAAGFEIVSRAGSSSAYYRLKVTE